VYIILGSVCCFFTENYMLYVIIYILFSILRSGMVLFCILQDSRPFGLALTLVKCILTHHRCPWVAMPVEERKHRRMSSQPAPRSTRDGCHGPWWKHNCYSLHFSSSYGWGWLDFPINRASLSSRKQTIHPIISFPLFKFLFRLELD